MRKVGVEVVVVVVVSRGCVVFIAVALSSTVSLNKYGIELPQELMVESHRDPLPPPSSPVKKNSRRLWYSDAVLGVR